MTSENTWESRDRETGRHRRNKHILELTEDDWRCINCGHHFDAASEADGFICGEDCTGKHGILPPELIEPDPDITGDTVRYST